MMRDKLTVKDFRFGEEVWCCDGICENVGKIVEIRKNGIKIKYTEGNSGRWFHFDKKTKILKVLRTLDMMTDEENLKFREEFFEGDLYAVELTDHSYSSEYDGEWVEESMSIEIYDYLTEMGFDIRDYIEEGLAIKEGEE